MTEQENIELLCTRLVCQDGQYISNKLCKSCQGHCKDGAPCNMLTGRCDDGCSNNWTGAFCES